MELPIIDLGRRGNTDGVTYEAVYDTTRVSFLQPTFIGSVPNDPGQFLVGERGGGFYRMVRNGALYEKKAWLSVLKAISGFPTGRISSIGQDAAGNIFRSNKENGRSALNARPIPFREPKPAFDWRA